MSKIDTSTVGPIRVEHDADAARAKLVRQALEAIGMDPAISFDEHRAFLRLASVGSDSVLARLGRSLR